MKTETRAEREFNGLEIAVIGMAGKFPGANNLDEYWENLINGVESIAYFSDEEMIESGIAPEVLQDPHFVKARGALEGLEYFDAAFFDYIPADAEVMEPQIRLFHEFAWTALEDAGYNPETFRELIGVFVGGLESVEWKARVLLRRNDHISYFAKDLLSNKDFLSTRISYKLNLRGPSYTIYTGCSTALTSIHTACRNLLSGECDMAIAGGVVACLPQKNGHLYQDGMISSADGHVRTFDAKATGTVFGNGIGVVVLKPLDRALEMRDSIYAIIKGSAVNNDGNQKVSFTAPSVKGQAQVIKAAHQIAEIDPHTISYIETHGTGTDLGDSIEIRALKEAFAGVDPGYTCKIGSVKTNFGHLDSASGAAGLIKTVLAMNHRLIPPMLHFENANLNCGLEDSPFQVTTRPTEWENGNSPLRAGVSSFGFGGTNAHLILEDVPPQWREVTPESSRNYQLLHLSARTEAALERGTGNLVNYFKEHPAVSLADAAYTLQIGRKAFNHRKMVICTGVDEAVAALASPDAPGAPETGKARTMSLVGGKRQVVFLFPGQGAQYVEMGRDLYRTEPVFRREMDRCFDILNSLADYNFKEILYPADHTDLGDHADPGNHEMSGDEGSSSTDINRTGITQPMIFAFEYALATLLMEWGIKPDAMTGHSIGEYTAALLSGVFSLEDALKLVVARGRLMQQMPGGAMLSVTLPEEELKPLLMNKALFLAAVNSSSLCTVSGSYEAIDAFEAELEEKGTARRRLHTSHAFHSDMMDPILTEFVRQVEQVTLNPPEIPYISNVTGTWITVEDAINPGYWATHLRDTVRFCQGLDPLLDNDNSLFIEVGPGLVLSSFISKHKDRKPGHITRNLVRHPHEPVADDFFLLNRIGELWLYGLEIDWQGFYSGEKRTRLHLPTYSFERTRFWIDKKDVGPAQAAGAGAALTLKTDVSDWFYLPSWKRSGLVLPATGKSGPADDILCLVFIDDTHLGTALLERFSQRKLSWIVVAAGSAFARENDNRFVINPGLEENYNTLFETLAGENRMPQLVVHLWNVTANQSQQPVLDRIKDTHEKGFYSLLHIARALGNCGITGRIRLKVVTNNMQEVTGNDLLYPEKAVILGAVKVIPLEFENILCHCIDIDWPGTSAQGTTAGETNIRDQLLDQLEQDLEAGWWGPPAALRGTYRWEQTVEPVRLEKPEELPFRLREQGVYLVTGGLGGMGLALAEHLAREVQARLILTGRSALPAREEWDHWLANHEEDDRVSRKIRKIRTLEEMGASVMTAAADVADVQQMKDVIDRARQQLGTINGVIHSAGLADYGGMIQLRSKDATEEVLAPKVIGTLILDSLLAETEPDFVIFCSSIAAITPSFGEVGYIAANTFLDHFAHYKSAGKGTYYGSINWWTWKEAGMAVDAAERMSKKKGASASHDILKDGILSSQGIDIFNRVLEHTFPQVIISLRDLQAMEEQLKAAKFADDSARPQEASAAATPKYQRPSLSTAYIPPGDEIEQTLTEIWQNQLGIEQIGIHDNFFDLGADSLNIVQIRAQIKSKLNKDIPIVTMYTYPTVSSLKEYIEEQKSAIGFSEAEAQRLKKKEDKGRDKLRQRQKRVKNKN